jgi:hypothetical protein
MSVSHTGGNSTSVEDNVTTVSLPEDVYTPSGVKVDDVNGIDALKKGVYIIGNRKVYVK